jgi:hypothetical protein
VVSIYAEGGAGRRHAKIADAPMNQSREALLAARPLHSPERARAKTAVSEVRRSTDGRLGWTRGIVVVVNSVLAGVFAGLLWRSVAGPSGPVPLALCAVAGFLLSMVSLGGYGQRTFRRDLAASPVAFPAADEGDDPAIDRAIES